MSENDTSETTLPEGQVCPSSECSVDQRFEGFNGFACPECGCRLAEACSRCNGGAVLRIDGSPRCRDHDPESYGLGDERVCPVCGGRQILTGTLVGSIYEADSVAGDPIWMCTDTACDRQDDVALAAFDPEPREESP